ncbi:MAG: hypothetical protein V4724_07040 [Pseudomonadota bacterium]
MNNLRRDWKTALAVDEGVRLNLAGRRDLAVAHMTRAQVPWYVMMRVLAHGNRHRHLLVAPHEAAQPDQRT